MVVGFLLRLSVTRIGFPHFLCHTPVLEWISKVEKFLNCYNTSDVVQVHIVTIHFDKEVVTWFQMLLHLTGKLWC